MKIMIDGQINDSNIIEIDPLSHGFQYGFGVFETMRLIAEGPEYFLEHMIRLENSLKTFDLNIEYTKDEIQKMISDLYIANDKKLSVVKTSVYKGRSKNYLIISMRENTYTNSNYEKGFKLCLGESRKNQFSKLVYHKTSNYMENLFERQNALKKGFDEVIFLNTLGFVTEGSVSNIFWVKNNELYTPEIQTGILNGIYRQSVIKRAKLHGIRLHECKYGIEELKTADAVFLTNSIMGIMPVSDFENTCYSRDNKTMNLLRNG